MYGYYEEFNLEPEDILEQVSQEDIFKLVIKEDIILEDKKYLAPYREDTNPDCYFREDSNIIYFIDFADSSSPAKNCFFFIQRCLGFSFKETLNYIGSKFNLGSGDITYKRVNENDCNVEEKKKNFLKKRDITIYPRPYSYKDKKYWEQYGISKQNLIEDKVIPIQMFSSYSRRGNYICVRPLDIMYAYTDFLEGKKKIYRPKTKKKLEKWFTNCSQNEIGGIRFLDKTKKQVVITKSYKDWRVLKNEGTNPVWFQNEGQVPSKKVLTKEFSSFEEIVIWFDNDSSGIGSSNNVKIFLQKLFPNKIIRTVFLPPVLLKTNIKDPSDLYKRKGQTHLINFLKKVNLDYYGR